MLCAVECALGETGCFCYTTCVKLACSALSGFRALPLGVSTSSWRFVRALWVRNLSGPSGEVISAGGSRRGFNCAERNSLLAQKKAPPVIFSLPFPRAIVSNCVNVLQQAGYPQKSIRRAAKRSVSKEVSLYDKCSRTLAARA